MLYQIYVENGWSPWLAFQTFNETHATEYFQTANAPYVYLRVLDDKGYVVSMRCESRQRNGL